MAKKITPSFAKTSTIISDKAAKPVILRLPEAHPKQAELINAFNARIDKGKVIYNPAYPNFKDLPLAYPNLRYIAGACGTKFGKTYGCASKIVEEAWVNKGSVNWWVAPILSQAKYAYALVKNRLPKDTYIEYKADLKLVLIEPDGSEHSQIEFKSADNEDSLRGFAVNFFIIDEAARVTRAAFDSVLTTTIATEGRGIAISTPKGRNWFYDVYQWGDKSTLLANEEDDHKEWYSIRMPTWTNPHIKGSMIENMRKQMPSEVFEQEVAARFMQNSAGVFRDVRDCIKGALDASGRPIWTPAQAGRRYVIGADLARKKDFTVLTVMDTMTRAVVYWDRFNSVSWEIQKHKIIELGRRYNNAQIWIDGTGVGDPVVEDVRNSGLPVECYIISSKTKQQLIDKLRVNIEFQKISFPMIGTLVKELENYEYKFSEASDTIKFSAPPGQHDDTVISLALANMGADQQPFFYRSRLVRGV